MKSVLTSPQSTIPKMITPDLYQQLAAKGNTAEISLTTQEGDKVTIREDMFQALYQEQQNSGEMNTGLSEAQSLMAGTSTNHSFLQVQGDLNEQEIEDLTALLDDLTEIAASFFSGNLAEAMAGAMEIGDMGSVAKLDATFTQSSVLSTYMATPHPIPQIGSATFDALLKENNDEQEFSKEGNTIITDHLKAQWQQLLDSLNKETLEEEKGKHQHLNHSKSHENQEPQHTEKKPIKDGQETGREMFARSRKILNNHPRLSPLLPSIAELAAQNAIKDYDHESNRDFMKDLGKYFKHEFHSWLIA